MSEVFDPKELEKRFYATCARKDVCFVCGGTLEDVFYADIDSFDDRTSWLDDIKVSASESKELKRCSRCGLLYAK